MEISCYNCQSNLHEKGGADMAINEYSEPCHGPGEIIGRDDGESLE